MPRWCFAVKRLELIPCGHQCAQCFNARISFQRQFCRSVARVSVAFFVGLQLFRSNGATSEWECRHFLAFNVHDLSVQGHHKSHAVDKFHCITTTAPCQNPFRITYSCGMQNLKNKGGRPQVSEENRLVQRSIRMKPAMWAKVDAHGIDWLRGVISRAKPPKQR